MKSRVIYTITITLIASILPDILFRELIGQSPTWLPYAKLIVLISASVFSYLVNNYKALFKYSIVLSTITGLDILIRFIGRTLWWKAIFDVNTFVGNFGGAIALKIIGVIPLIFILLFLFKTPKEAYLSKGDLSIKADKINWLGINENTISWGRLSIISAVLISFGTIILTIITTTGISTSNNIDKLISFFPLIVIFALLNSFCEGVVYRSSVLGSLKEGLSKKQTILIAALFFGIAHYYGAPSGVLGVGMSGLLGWYMTTSMYETRGFLSSWIIHFMQDIVIFSTILIMQ